MRFIALYTGMYKDLQTYGKLDTLLSFNRVSGGRNILIEQTILLLWQLVIEACVVAMKSAFWGHTQG